MKDNPDEVIVEIQDAAVEWRTVEQADKMRSKSRGAETKEDAFSTFDGAAKTSGDETNRGSTSIYMIGATKEEHHWALGDSRPKAMV